jgi:hypothetical protein
VCGYEFSLLILHTKESANLECTACGSADLSRLMSKFAYHQMESSRIEALDTSKPRDDSYYRDSRNIGLWAKKRAKELGADLGERFEETVEKARTGKFVEDIEK